MCACQSLFAWHACACACAYGYAQPDGDGIRMSAERLTVSSVLFRAVEQQLARGLTGHESEFWVEIVCKTANHLSNSAVLMTQRWSLL